MKVENLTVFDTTKAVKAIERAGRRAGITAIAKLCGVTSARAKKSLVSSINLGMVYTYSNVYREGVQRTCYSVTETGQIMLDVLEEHKRMMEWVNDHAETD